MPDKKWIHNFTITETRKHKNGFTIYKITSIIFPRNIPETLSKVEVWKRFKEIKNLYKEVSTKYKNLHMRGVLPELKQTFFKRFEPDVIEERKLFIIDLLYYIADHPVLYKSNIFLKFFDGGLSPEQSPRHNSNIANICAELDLEEQPEIVLLDPTRDIDHESVLDQTESTIETISSSHQREVSQTNGFDYIYEAALEFSNALQAEVNCSYKEAFDGYKSGIDSLLTGARSDSNLERRRIAKEKTEKYLGKAEELYEKYILMNVENDCVTTEEEATNSNIYLERPISHLSKYKVVRIIDNVMQVQNVTDKKFYIMKVVEKFSTHNQTKSIFIPKNIPFMIPLISYFQSENSVYLLLKQASGGKLSDYILSYGKKGKFDSKSDIRNIFTDSMKNLTKKNKIPNISIESTSSSIPTLNISESNSLESSGYDSGFVDLVTDNKSLENINTELGSKMKQCININDSILENMEEIYIPSFDILSKDMEVIDLVDCSQKLLNSVTNTLQKTKFVERIDEINDFILVNPIIEVKKEVLTELKTDRVELATASKTIEETSSNNIIKKSYKLIECNVLLPEGIIILWASQLFLAISHLHENGIVCRDLRMGNLLLGGNGGKLQLTFFYRRSEKDLNSESMENMYVAPERPLTKESDWWSFGVILFELITGKSFYSCHPGGISSYYDVQYPHQTEISVESINILDGLLQVNPDLRFKIDDIKSHPFFKTTIWDELLIEGIEKET